MKLTVSSMQEPHANEEFNVKTCSDEQLRSRMAEYGFDNSITPKDPEEFNTPKKIQFSAETPTRRMKGIPVTKVPPLRPQTQWVQAY